MKTWLLTLLGFFLLASVAAGQDSPRVAPERLVLRTLAGDVVIALYPDVAPQHVAQVMKLARLGAYDTTHFYRMHPGFVAQLSVAQDRLIPLTTEQRASLHPLKAEFSKLIHRRGVVSMARDDNPDSAESSFSVLLGDAPHLDGRYTIFGHVERGMEVFDAMLKVPADPPGYQPAVRLTVLRMEAVDSFEDLSSAELAPARPVALTAEDYARWQARRTPAGSTAAGLLTQEDAMSRAVHVVLVFSLVLMIAVGLSYYCLAGRLAPSRLLSLNLINVLIGGFVLFLLANPLALSQAQQPESSRPMSLLLFAGLLGLFKLVGRFESPE